MEKFKITIRNSILYRELNKIYFERLLIFVLLKNHIKIRNFKITILKNDLIFKTI